MNTMNITPVYVTPQSAESPLPADEVLCVSAGVETMHENTIIYD